MGWFCFPATLSFKAAVSLNVSADTSAMFLIAAKCEFASERVRAHLKANFSPEVGMFTSSDGVCSLGDAPEQYFAASSVCYVNLRATVSIILTSCGSNGRSKGAAGSDSIKH